MCYYETTQYQRVNLKLLDSQLNKLKPATKISLPLMKNVLTPLSKSMLIPLGLTAKVSAADAEIHKNL